MDKKTRPLVRGAARYRLISGEFSAKNEVCGLLCLGCCVNQKLAIIAKFAKPTGDIGGLILNHDRRDSRFGAKESRSHFGAEFLFGICRGTKRGGLGDRLARKAFRMSTCMGLMPISA